MTTQTNATLVEEAVERALKEYEAGETDAAALIETLYEAVHTLLAALPTDDDDTVADAVIEAGLTAWDRIVAAQLAREASDNPEDMPDYDSGDIVKAVYRAMRSKAIHTLIGRDK